MNCITLMGNIGRIELTYTQAKNTAVCKFSLAVPRRFKKDETDWINCVAFAKTGEFINSWFDVGKKIAIVGSIQVRSWDNKEGKKQYTTEVIVDSAYFCESKLQGEREIESQVSKEADAADTADTGFELPSDFDTDAENLLPF